MNAIETVYGRAQEYLELHDHVESSNALLENLETFLSTFQRDLSAVSGHISELQARSRVIEGRLQGRKVIDSAPLLQCSGNPAEPSRKQ
jgi:vacuolar protein sorting-associated protein 52